MLIKCTKAIDGAELPKRMHYNDAGADVFTCEDAFILPHETAVVSLGISVELPDGFMACIFPRSGMASEGTVCELSPIDSGYRGVIGAIVTNLTDKAKAVYKGTRIGQLVVLPCVMADFAESLGDERGSGGFGSTGTN